MYFSHAKIVTLKSDNSLSFGSFTKEQKEHPSLTRILPLPPEATKTGFPPISDTMFLKHGETYRGKQK